MNLRPKQLNLTEDIIMTGGRIQLSTGTASSPSLTFSDHSNTGIYLASAGKIGFSTSGIQRVTINTVAVETAIQVRLPSGSDTSPALSFSASTQTGWLYDAGKVALTLGGTRFWEAGTNGTITQNGDLNLTSHNITNVALVNGVDILSHASRHLPNGSDPLATASAVGLSLATANAAGSSNAFARSDHTHAITGVQASSTELTALAGLSATGIVTRSAANTYVTRSVTGTTNTITVSNGNGVSGNPTITLANNPIIPGTASLTLPIGTTPQRAASPVAGMIRYNSDLTALEYYANTAWNTIELNKTWNYTGDVTGSGNGTVALTLANSGVSAGTYKSVTVDSKGRVTGGTNPTTLAGYGITDALTGVSAGQGIAVTGTTSPTIAIANNPVIPGTEALTLPNGTTAQRNGSPAFGESRYNTDLGQVEFYQAGGWYTPPTATARQVVFYADHFDNPYTSNWAISNIAPATQDSTNSGLSVRAFDDTTEEGVGFMFTIPTGVTSVTFTFKARLGSTQSTSRGLVMKLYKRSIGNNSSVSGWSSVVLNTMTFSNTTNFQYFSSTYSLSSLNLTAGTLYQFELTRTGTAGADTITGDVRLLEFGALFT